MKDQHDPLEEFIQKNRDDFDVMEPTDALWPRIRRSLRTPTVGLWDAVWVWRAAAMIFMALSAYLVIPKNGELVTAPRGNDLGAAEFKDVEAFYFQQISEKVELIDDYQRLDGLNGFTHDFQQLEAMYMVLKEEMKVQPSQKVRDAMVLNLLVQIDLLNQRLHNLETEYEQKNKDENSESV
jgi:hypothetical protein